MENKEMTNEEKFKSLLSTIHQDLLKSRGFKKDGQNFRLIVENNSLYTGYIINFQKSAYNDRSELRFAVNIGKINSNSRINEKFKEYETKNRERLAVIVPQYGFDKWWSITSDTDITEIRYEMIDLINNIAFPWFGI
jgi:hypothetical protein